MCKKIFDFVPKDNKKHPNGWTVTGAKFAVPYVFKTLFSKESIEFEDLCETKAVKSAIYLDNNENLPKGEHDYQFIGKVGLFCPIKPGCGGGVLVRESTDSDGNIKYDSVTGTLKPDKTPYRWLEAEYVKTLEKEDDIDKSYYKRLVDDAVLAISQYCDFEQFVADEPFSSDSLGTLPEFPLPTGGPFEDDDLPWYTDDELDAFKKR